MLRELGYAARYARRSPGGRLLAKDQDMSAVASRIEEKARTTKKVGMRPPGEQIMNGEGALEFPIKESSGEESSEDRTSVVTGESCLSSPDMRNRRDRRTAEPIKLFWVEEVCAPKYRNRKASVGPKSYTIQIYHITDRYGQTRIMTTRETRITVDGTVQATIHRDSDR
jgi:hypothetical protein